MVKERRGSVGGERPLGRWLRKVWRVAEVRQEYEEVMSWEEEEGGGGGTGGGLTVKHGQPLLGPTPATISLPSARRASRFESTPSSAHAAQSPTPWGRHRPHRHRGSSILRLGDGAAHTRSPTPRF